jgi:5-formyltetrahydrofolate cyclo-ligase
LDTTTVLLLEVDPESLRFEDDAVVFSSPSRLQVTQRGGARESNSICFFCCGPGFYTTSRDSKTRPLQLLDEPLPETIHDFRVDLVVTPDEAIWCTEPHRPPGILWDHLDQDKIAEVPALAALAAQR